MNKIIAMKGKSKIVYEDNKKIVDAELYYDDLKKINYYYEIDESRLSYSVYPICLITSYIELYKPKVLQHDADKKWFEAVLGQKVWECDDRPIAPLDIINNIDEKCNKDHMDRINFIDTSYPIITTIRNNQIEILDGFHRLAKKYIEKDYKLYYYDISPNLLKKFAYMKDVKLKTIPVASITDIMVYFFETFCEKPKKII